MRQADYLARRAERLGEMAMKVEARPNSVCGKCATAGGEDARRSDTNASGVPR
jgi:hypothetical protein